jgi:hypothetical protein
MDIKHIIIVFSIYLTFFLNKSKYESTLTFIIISYYSVTKRPLLHPPSQGQNKKYFIILFLKSK